MSKKSETTPLDRRAQDRLDRLSRDWESDPSSYFLEKLTPADLRLLLEHFKPLRRLIREIAAGSAAPSGEESAELDALREELEEARAAQEELRRERDEALAAQKRLRDQLHAAEQTHETLRRERDAARREREELQQRYRTLEAELAASRSEAQTLRQRRSDHPVVAILRRDTALAAALGLEALDGPEPEPLIRTVAVLAQMETIRRLWDRLKERCERERRPATGDERLLLETALAWHNHNWPSKPYQLVAPQPGSAYDFNSHQRATATASGDTIAALWLPGIMDGSGRIQQKPLVTTQ